MKKVFTLIVVLVLCMNYTKGQVKLNEVHTGSNNKNNQYIELFAPSGTISDYKIFIRYDNGGTDNGFYILSLSGATPTSPYYFVTEFSSQGIWTNTSSIYKISYSGIKQSTAGLNFNSLLNNAGKNMIFLVKNNKVVDIVVFGGGTKFTTVKSVVDSWSPFITQAAPVDQDIYGLNVSFKNLSITNFNAPNESVGSGSSLSFFYTQSGCDILSYPWQKTPFETKGSINQLNGNFTSVAPSSTYWESAFYLYPNSRSNPVLTISGNIGENSFSFDYTSTGNASHLYFEYSIINSTISPISLTSEPLFKVYLDHGATVGSIPDDAFDPAVDVDITDLVTRELTTTPGRFKVNFPIDVTPQSQMYYTVGTNKYLRPFHVVLRSQNSCKIESFMLKAAAIFNLPVKFFKFELNSNKLTNLISWGTTTEQNNKGFEIQRSIGNTNDFKTIGFVGTRAKDGNSQTEINYSFEDADVKAGQTHYYRLNQIDFDGKSSFSPVKSIKPGSIESNLNVYPNPSQGSFTVNTGSNSGKLNIFVMDNTGRVVNQYMNVSTSNTRINNLKKGFYTLKIVNTESGEQSAQRVVVQ